MLSGVLSSCFRTVCLSGLILGLLGLSPPLAVADSKPGLLMSDLVIRVTGLESGRGNIEYALYDSVKHFPTRVGRIAKGAVSANLSGTTIVLKGLTPGYYAVAIFHDENSNGEFDQGLFGYPLETYGFSNDARGFFSAPDFDSAKFRVDGQKTEISIELTR